MTKPRNKDGDRYCPKHNIVLSPIEPMMEDCPKCWAEKLQHQYDYGDEDGMKQEDYDPTPDA